MYKIFYKICLLFTLVYFSFGQQDGIKLDKEKTGKIKSNDDIRQEQLIHKYLTWEAWELVKLQHQEVIGTEMDIRVQDPEHNWDDNWYDGESAWYPAKVLTGAFREDEEDVIYDYGGLNVSNTHFWLADFGDDWLFYPPYISNGYENSLMKLRAFWTGKLPGGAGAIIVGPFFYTPIFFLG
jgi:hypothetical protein